MAVTAAIYAAGVLASYGYTQIKVRAAQQVVFDIRRDLFSHLQVLPLQFFDTRAHGDLMSLFTNDVDTISDALNNSFAMVIQSAIQMVGTLFSALRPQLASCRWWLVLGYWAMFLYIRYSGRKSRRFLHQPADLPGRAGRVYPGDGGRTEGGQGIQSPARGIWLAFLEQNEKLRRRRHQRPILRRHHGAGGGQHFLCQLCGGGGAGRLLAIRGKMDE